MVGSALRADLGSVVGDAARSARSADPTRYKQGRTCQMISLPWVGLSALAQPRLTKGGQPYPKTEPCVVRFSLAFISGGRWQPRVAGGGTYPFSPPRSPQRSPQFSPPISPLPSVICHRFSHPRCPYPNACTPPILDTPYSILSAFFPTANR